MTLIDPQLVLAHRGLWSESAPPNSLTALLRAASNGLGIETDIRDLSGKLIISHDPPSQFDPLAFETVANRVSALHGVGVLALNIKADGLADWARVASDVLENEHFFFDMSMPEFMSYSRRGLPLALRVSEVERPQDLSPKARRSAAYLWIDCFDEDWFLTEPALAESMSDVTSFLVSPEIHGREPRLGWEWLVMMSDAGYRVGLCTDRPMEFLEWQSM